MDSSPRCLNSTIDSTTVFRSSRTVFFALFLLSLATITVHITHFSLAEDDAFIHMRIARNLWNFGVPYFNPEEKIMASTAPLWIVVTSVFASSGPLMPIFISIFNCVLTIYCTLLSAFLCKKITPQANPIFSLLAGLITWSSLISSSAALMETPLTIAFLLKGTSLLVERRTLGAAFFCAALFLRPEVAAFILLGFGVIVFRRDLFGTEFKIKLTSVGVATLIPLVLFQLYFFQSLIPRTAQVKSIVYDLSYSESLRSFTHATFGESVATKLLPCCIILSVVIILCLIYVAKSIDLGRVNKFSLPLIASGLTVLTAYILRHILVFPWYTPLVTTPLGLGVVILLASNPQRLLLLFVASVLAPFIVTASTFLLATWWPYLSPMYLSGSRADVLNEIGDHLRTCRPSATVMAPEIGALGYSFGGDIIDGVGLASIEALQFHPLKIPQQRANGAIGGVPAQFALKINPEFIVGLGHLLHDLSNSEEISKRYVKELIPLTDAYNKPISVWGNDSITVYRRKDIPACALLNE